MKTLRIFMVVATSALLVSGCNRKPMLLEPSLSAPNAPMEASARVAAGGIPSSATAGSRSLESPMRNRGGASASQMEKHLQGEIGPGALYSIDVPAAWNGDLVLYAHGYTLPQSPVTLPAIDNFNAVRDLLMARGFALAATSYSENGYAEAEGARQVHQLRGLFSDLCAEPNRTFLFGYSLGGLIGLDLVQNHPSEYAGALLISGVVGGTRAEISYVGDLRVIFDCVCPNVLPGGVTDVPDGVPYPQGAVLQCLTSGPQPLGGILCTFRDPRFRLAGSNPTEWVTSVVRLLGFHWYAAEDLFDRTHEHQLYDNHDVTYASCVPNMNDCVARYTATPDAEAFMRQHYEPNGVVQKPVLTLHAEHDPVVPAGHEALFYDKVAAAGHLANLLQCIYPRYGHTEAFTPQEAVTAFDALVGWVDTGVKPPCPTF